MNTNLDHTIQIRLPKDIVLQIDKLIDLRQGQNRSDIVRKMIMKYLDDNSRAG